MRRAEKGSAERDRRALLMAAASKDDSLSFRALVRQRRLTAELTRAAHHRVAPSACEALVEATWVAAWERRRQYRESVSVLVWLESVMDEQARSVNPASARADDLTVVTTAAEVRDLVAAESIDAALARMSRNHAALVRMRYLAELDWTTICAVLGYADAHEAQRAYSEAIRELRARYRAPADSRQASTS